MTEPVTIGVAIITRDNLQELKELLNQLADLDQVVVVDTGSRDGTRAYVRGLGKPFELHEFKWRPRPADHQPDEWGFAAARNESFRHLHTTHAIWLDSDDMIEVLADGRRVIAPADAVAKMLRKLAADSSNADVFILDYLYMTDEFGNPMSVLGKERLLKRSTGWTWRHPVHELVVPTGTAIKDVMAIAVRDIAIAHRPHDVEASANRNRPMLRAWLKQLEKGSPPDADLARARFLVGRSLFGHGEYLKSARWMLTQYLGKHPHVTPEDKWEGWMQVAKSLHGANDIEGARQAVLQAIGLCPRFGESYVLLAELKSSLGERPGDVLKLLEVAASCSGEGYGTHERNPMIGGFEAALIGSESQFRLGRYREALVLADRALAMRPPDERARAAWQKAADASKTQLAEPDQGRAVSAAIQVSHDRERTNPPVFVVSSGRCGSTLVSNMLRLHPDVLSLSEFLIMLSPGAFPGAGFPIYGPQFWALLSTPRKRMTLMYQKGIAFNEILYRPGPGSRFTAESGVPPILLTALPHLTDEPEALYDEIHDFVIAQGPHPVGRHYELLFDWLRKRFDKKVWVERSGSLLVHLDELIANFPGARFVHLYRDGRECAISMAGHSAFRLSIVTGRLMESLGIDPFNTDEPGTGVIPDDLRPFMPETFDADAFWKFDLPIEKLGASWSNAESHALTLMAQLPFGRVYQLRYENLVAAPEQVLAAMAPFIGVPEPNKDWLKAAAALVKVKPPALPTLPEAQRARLEESCRVAMGLLYGADMLEPIPV